MATDNFIQPAILYFDDHYDHWNLLIENFLRSKETELEGQCLKVLKAKNYLFQAIGRSILETILYKDTSKHIWDSMKKKY
ncbi:hypothetical protein ACOSQ4_017636 [Xanthoceras sorbifolium]